MMEHAPTYTLVFIALLALMSLPMAIAVGLRRAKTGIMMLAGDDEDLLRRIRAHGNFIEYVPLALLALAGAEMAGAAPWLLITCGLVLMAARLIHYIGFRHNPNGPARLIGTLMTTLTILALSVAILLRMAGLV
ncbi:MAPEG family protein [Roseobacter sinensis]|uniref:MAPEG family protein n=1 Tax=Roseobacter sinensis TaxID=2931391 RepID=A0ABT3BAX0_9RHOB|nr:MAPEG family protein [Roseobacter sp. WL0113]MCV3270731.1 MAPEG family protein [Roseobacter sp. WL0113]